MATITHLRPFAVGERIDAIDITNDPDVTICANNGDLILKTKDRTISINDLISRLNSLEEAYMEDKLLGIKSESNQEDD